MIDWSAMVTGPCHRVFGEPAVYEPASGPAFGITVVFDPAFQPVDAGTGMPTNSTAPIIGVQLSEFPAGFDALNAQDEHVTITRTGQRYVVKSGKPDGHGYARLDLNLAP